MTPERKLHLKVCQHLKLFYPHVYFDSDPSGLKVSGLMATLLQKTRSDHKHLDITIYKKFRTYSGLIIELKAETIYKKDGQIKSSEHLDGQDKTKKLLESEGFKVEVAWEFEEVERILVDYLGAPIQEPDEFFDQFKV